MVSFLFTVQFECVFYSFNFLICFYLSSNLLLLPSSVFFKILVIVFFSTVWFFFICFNSFGTSHCVCSSPGFDEHLYTHYLELFTR